MTSHPIVPNTLARRLLLQRQGLCHAPRRKLDAAGLGRLIEEMGFVQVDSIAAVERAHHMIVFARNETYRPGLLTRALERDRTLFENWTHDASIIPSRFFPYWRPRFRREAERLRARYRDWHGEVFESHLTELLERIRDEGPVMARDFNHTRPQTARGWWDWHPAKTALEYLWRTGALSICRREGFQKVYDLTERVLPQIHRDNDPHDAAYVDWAASSALERLGFATSGELAAFWASITPAEAKGWCDERLAAGELIEVPVETADGKAPRKALGRPETLEGLSALSEAPPRLRALSPFDPVIRDRNRLQRLFAFDYRIEIFVPAAQRRYGYYVFPLLEGERFVGRLDMRHDKAADALRVTALWPEPRVRWGTARQRRLEAELERHRRYLGAGRVAFDDNWHRSGRQ
jgi:uncharacterized protein YcaQ